MGPHKIEVKIVSREEMAKVANEFDQPGVPWGLCDYDGGTIYVQRVSKAHPPARQLHTFWHEYFHMLFHTAGRYRLAKDEGLVDLCGGLHLQALGTAE